MIKGHSYIGWISLIVGVVSFILALLGIPLGIFEIEWEAGMGASFYLGFIALITGLIARFGRTKDNFGVAGISLGIIAGLWSIAW